MPSPRSAQNGSQPSGNQPSQAPAPDPTPEHSAEVVAAIEHAMVLGAQKAAGVQDGDQFQKFATGVAQLAKALGAEKPAPPKPSQGVGE